MLVVDTAEFSMLIAARRAGVPLIEVQHGVFTAERPDALAPLLALDQGSLLLPDYYAAFGNRARRRAFHVASQQAWGIPKAAPRAAA